MADNSSVFRGPIFAAARLLFADACLVIHKRLGQNHYNIGQQVQSELHDKGWSTSGLNVVDTSARANSFDTSKYAALKAKTDQDWKVWVEVPPSSILVTSDLNFAKNATRHLRLAENDFGEVAPIAVIMPRHSAHEGKETWFGHEGKISAFADTDEFEESLRSVNYDQAAWIASMNKRLLEFKNAK